MYYTVLLLSCFQLPFHSFLIENLVLVLSICWVFVRNEGCVRFFKYTILNELVIFTVKKIFNL